MSDLVTIMSFSNFNRAHLAKAKLESENIRVFLKDEHTVSTTQYAQPFGGIKLQVRTVQLERATQLLIDSGYLEISSPTPNNVLNSLNDFTKGLPLIGQLVPEIRLAILFGITGLITVLILLSIYS